MDNFDCFGDSVGVGVGGWVGGVGGLGGIGGWVGW